MNKKYYTITFLLVIISAVISALISTGIAAAQSSRSQQTVGQTTAVQKWEYEIVTGDPMLPIQGNPINAFLSNPLPRLNSLGAQGYEVAGFTVPTGSSEPIVFVLLKRPKP